MQVFRFCSHESIGVMLNPISGHSSYIGSLRTLISLAFEYYHRLGQYHYNISSYKMNNKKYKELWIELTLASVILVRVSNSSSRGLAKIHPSILVTFQTRCRNYSNRQRERVIKKLASGLVAQQSHHTKENCACFIKHQPAAPKINITLHDRCSVITYYTTDRGVVSSH